MSNTNTEITPDTESRVMEEIEMNRREIDAYDGMAAFIFGLRFAKVQRIGELKRSVNLPVYDRGRESRQLSRYLFLARENNIPPEQIIVPFMIIIHLSKKAQNGTPVVDDKPIVPKTCPLHSWRTCGIEIPESAVRVCPSCRSPLF